MKNKYRIHIDLEGDVAKFFDKKTLPHGFKKLFVQKLVDDFIKLSGKKNIGKNIVKYIAGDMSIGLFPTKLIDEDSVVGPMGQGKSFFVNHTGDSMQESPSKSALKDLEELKNNF